MDKIKLTDRTKFWTHKCGCMMEKEENRWFIKDHCKTHRPDFKKKVDKLMRQKEKKSGRGWTKPLVRNQNIQEKRRMRQKIM